MHIVLLKLGVPLSRYQQVPRERVPPNLRFLLILLSLSLSLSRSTSRLKFPVHSGLDKAIAKRGIADETISPIIKDAAPFAEE